MYYDYQKNSGLPPLLETASAAFVIIMALLTKWLLEAYLANHAHLVQPYQERGTRGQPHVIKTWAPVAVRTPRQIIDARHYNLGARDRTYTPADHRRMRLRGNVYCSVTEILVRRKFWSGGPKFQENWSARTTFP